MKTRDLLGILAVVLGAPGATAATITVTSLGDNTSIDGQVTLREAILASNIDTSVDGSTPGSGGDEIVFATGPGTIQLNGTRADANDDGLGGGGGIYAPAVPVLLRSTIGAENAATSAGRQDVAGSAHASSADNVIGVDTGFTGISSGLGGNRIGTAASPLSPLLGPLQNNGGPTLTGAVLPGSPALAANTTRFFNVAGRCGVPADARAVAFNVTVVEETDFGDLRLYPADAAAPAASTINYVAGRVRANNAVIPRGGGGRLAFQCDMPGAAGATRLVLDLHGYFK